MPCPGVMPKSDHDLLPSSVVVEGGATSCPITHAFALANNLAPKLLIREDDEPLSKRVKVSYGELRGLLNSTPFRELATCSSSDSMARPLASQGDEEMVGSRRVIKKEEFVRIIAEALYSLGFEKTGSLLEEESGISLHSSVVNLFMQQILDGNWDESVATLHKIGLMDETIIKLASFVILEQKFLELLAGEKVMDALKTLRTEITPLCINTSRLRELSSCIVSPSQCALVGFPGQDIARTKSRPELLEELQKLLPPTVMIPERRLEHLVEQALNLQLDACMFHNSLDSEMSLYTDHQCGKDQIPSQTLQIEPMLDPYSSSYTLMLVIFIPPLDECPRLEPYLRRLLELSAWLWCGSHVVPQSFNGILEIMWFKG
ncbi:hypothetical protein F0562_019610 [Nyssa sinensis]|uniref:CTLH domain-containing protein n=1 Tax=Nyssa sinensis TaxID=561372 RepID=A0A5J5BPK9_9ASTE|nr:hypothetical protein F0562_019610 [Nyssa sinensis]